VTVRTCLSAPQAHAIIAVQKEEAEKSLLEAEPALAAAGLALENLDPADIAEVLSSACMARRGC
jgi:hypothetical protein